MTIKNQTEGNLPIAYGFSGTDTAGSKLQPDKFYWHVQRRGDSGVFY